MGGPEGYGEADVPSILESKQEDMGELWRGGECKDTRIGMGGVAKLDVDRDFLCPICIQTMKDVFLTACGHSFCYTCITTHLHIKNNCPCCGLYLTTTQLFPNHLLSKFLTKVSACQFVAKASPMENICLALTKGEVTVRELDTLLTLLQAKKQKAEQEEAEANMEILMEFLHRSREAKETELNELQRDLQFLKEDISFVEKQRADLLLSKERFSKKIRIFFDSPSPQLDGLASVNSSTGGAVSVARSGQSGAGVPSRASQRTGEGRYRSSTASSLRREASDDPSDLNGAESRGMAAKKRKIHSQFDDLQECYLQNRRKAKASKESSAAKDAVSGSTRTGLDDFNSVLTAITRYSKLRVIAELRHGDLFQSTNIISSIEFDKDDQFFATAGVSRRIKVFEYESVVNEAATVHCPISEMTTRSKLSCLSWNKYIKSHIASSDYEGIVTVWDVNTHQSIMEYEEHEKRAWSVDFSRTEPTRLVSGSDDGKVKVWCTRQDTSVLDIDIKAPICCVKYNPGSSNYVAVGSADTRVHYFDLRHTQQPLYMFDGHEKPVSYVKFLSQNELASASTDGTLRLWDVQNNLAIRTLQGHTNEKNFVGLTVNSEYIACGSETNEVFVYNKAMSRPTAVHRFGSDQDDSDDDASLFVSAVCWKSESPTMLAANSQGTIKVLVLAP